MHRLQFHQLLCAAAVIGHPDVIVPLGAFCAWQKLLEPSEWLRLELERTTCLEVAIIDNHDEQACTCLINETLGPGTPYHDRFGIYLLATPGASLDVVPGWTQRFANAAKLPVRATASTSLDMPPAPLLAYMGHEDLVHWLLGQAHCPLPLVAELVHALGLTRHGLEAWLARGAARSVRQDRLRQALPQWFDTVLSRGANVLPFSPRHATRALLTQGPRRYPPMVIEGCEPEPGPYS